MPYKNLQRKKEWEDQHRAQRLARRRELRQIEAAWKEAHPGAVRISSQGTVASFLLPLAAGGALASYDPILAMGVGGLTLAVAAVYKKDWHWWIAGVLILFVGLFFRWTTQDEKK